MTRALHIDVRTSGIWQLCSAVLTSGGVSLVVDPGYFPRELDELAALAAERGVVRQVAFTHGHWDHAMGWRHFPGAEIVMSPALQDAIATGGELVQKNLADAEDFDRTWYIERYTDGTDLHSGIAPPGFPPLARTHALAEGAQLLVGEAQLVALHLPGHSIDGLGLWAREDGLLLIGDYLSPCEIPFVDDLHAYRMTLRRLLATIDSDVRTVYPGHGRPQSAREATAIAEADLAYLDALAECALRRDAAAALALRLPRRAEQREMQAHHRDNCRAAGLDVK